MVVAPDAVSPFRTGAKLPTLWPFSPFLFRDEYQARPWYAFEDWHPRHDELEILFRSVLGKPTFRVAFPVDAAPVVCRLPDDRNRPVLTALMDYVKFDGSIFWDAEGRVFINYFSDFLMTNLNEVEARSVFGCSLSEMWDSSDNCFTDPKAISNGTVRAAIGQFVDELRSTWAGGKSL